MSGSLIFRAIFLTSLDSFLSSLILYMSMLRLVVMKKLKSSPKTKLNAKMALAFWKVSLISSAARSFRKSRIREFSAT